MAFFINTQFDEDPNVRYHGKILPKDKAAPAQPIEDPNVPYAGKNLPSDRKRILIVPELDLTNNPSRIIIGGVLLPPDTVISKDGEKVIPGTKILDGVYVAEHVGRMPFKIEFDGTFRVTDSTKTVNIFPQDIIDDFFQNLFIPDTVQVIQNTFLNKIGIQEVIIEKIKTVTVRGSTNVHFKLWAMENVVGQTLIIG